MNITTNNLSKWTKYISDQLLNGMENHKKQTTTSRHDFKVNTNTTRIYDIANKQICLLL